MIYYFERYRNGNLMAEGVTVYKAVSFENACEIAARLCVRENYGPHDVLVLSKIVYGDKP